MQVFKPSNESHFLKIIPRYSVEECTINIRHELTDVLTTLENKRVYCDNGYATIPFDFTFKEGGSYHIEILSDILTIWRGKAYATNETDIENYKLL